MDKIALFVIVFTAGYIMGAWKQAHHAAQSGDRVEVLSGLAEYTKK